ncbi:MAG: ABC transporter substrate-binding protein [Alphaproteobacteria bacterium]|nr:MAG: ABC transporter substrate-binding protein [Alphaproteobacteria bacterium]
MICPTPNDPARRRLLGGAAALVGLAALPSPLRALTEADGRALIDRAVAEINAVINSGRSKEWMFARFQEIFWKYADVPRIAASALGPTARSLSRAQLKAYTDAFARYMARKYGARFREFIGGRVEVRRVRSAGRYVEVVTTAVLRGQPPFEVVFIVSDRGGAPKFIDMVIEGVSLLKSEAVEIRAMLDRNRGSISGLIEDLKKAA